MNSLLESPTYDSFTTNMVPRQHVPLLLRWFSSLVLKLYGWETVGSLAGVPKCVVIARHTSGWDVIFGLAVGYTFDVRPRWLVKREAVTGIIGKLMLVAGCIPVDRSRQNQLVDQVASIFAEQDVCVLYVTPEGTRSKTGYWKTGFYYIAKAAGVPIVCAHLDYKERNLGFTERLYPSDDIEADMEIIRSWFANITPKHPDQVGEIRLKSETSP